MTDLIFASGNEHKAKELREIVGERFSFTTLNEAGLKIDIPEPMTPWKKMLLKSRE
jgi:inosine/xanthosine triphosphate pyrophosphatase family protein